MITLITEEVIGHDYMIKENTQKRLGDIILLFIILMLFCEKVIRVML